MPKTGGKIMNDIFNWGEIDEFLLCKYYQCTVTEYHKDWVMIKWLDHNRNEEELEEEDIQRLWCLIPSKWLERQKLQEVIIRVDGGVAELVRASKGIKVIIRDYDNGQIETDEALTELDEDGYRYVAETYEAEE